MNRRTFLNLTASGFLAAGLNYRADAQTNNNESLTESPNKKFNVLMIAVDDLNDWITPLGGHRQTRTPNLQRLADKAVVFEQAYCPAPLCNPCRTSIMIGLHPASSGIYSNEVCFRDQSELKDRITLPQYFRKQGYQTLAGGKIYHLPNGKFSDPQSWDVMYQQRCGTPNPPKDKQYPHRLNGKFSASYYNRAMDWVGLNCKDEDTEDWKTADMAGKILQQKQDKPFFLACGIFKPHMPWYAPHKYFDMHPLDTIQLPDYKRDDLDDAPTAAKRMVGGGDFRIIRDSGQWKNAVQGYLACISFADACIGHVLDALENSPCKDNTIVVLWGDHGFHLGQKDHWGKYTLWETASRTPLIIHVPGMTGSGGRCSHPVSLLDIHATLIELCGLDARSDIEGRSLAPLLENPKKEWPYPAVMTHTFNNHAVRDHRYRYIRYADGGEELYDHQTDPNEWTNLAEDEKYNSVKENLAKWIPEKNEPEFTGNPDRKKTGRHQTGQ